MLASHIEVFRPTCPTCRVAGREPTPLELGPVVLCVDDDIVEGAIHCPEPLCRREHPIIDGIGVVVADLQTWAGHQLGAVLRRHDLSPFMESLLGDAAGPESEFEASRLTLSTYARSHWGDRCVDVPGSEREGILSLVEQALELLPAEPGGVWADLGCAVGRASFELAGRGADMVAGVDLNFEMLRVAERARRDARVTVPIRRVGLVYDQREFVTDDLPIAPVSFWCSDATMLPFDTSTVGGALSLNLIDCVHSPLDHLVELGRVLQPGGSAIVSSPYDWSRAATPVEGWLGGHSQRGPTAGSSSAELRRILSADRRAGLDTALEIVDELDPVTWSLRTHERARTEYDVDVVRLQRRSQDA